MENLVQGALSRYGASQLPGMLGLPEPDTAVYIDGQKQEGVQTVSTSFRGVRVKTRDANGDYTVSIEKFWRVQLQELLPAGTVEQGLEENFSLELRRSGGSMCYDGCRWESVTTEPTACGMGRTRVAVTTRPPVTA